LTTQTGFPPGSSGQQRSRNPVVEAAGDRWRAIFAGSMGGAKQFGALAKQKVREQILTLPPDTLICPGHGPLTTVGQEKENNPFFG